MIRKPSETIMEKAQVQDSAKANVYSRDYEPPQPEQAMVTILAADLANASNFAAQLAERLKIEASPVARTIEQYQAIAKHSEQVIVISTSLATQNISPDPKVIGTTIYLTNGPMTMDPGVMVSASHIVHGDQPMDKAVNEAEEKVRTTLSNKYGK